VLYRLS